MIPDTQVSAVRVGAAAISMIALMSSACSGGEPEAGEVFREEVAPVLESRCAAAVCHGITSESRAAGAELPEGSFALDIDRNGELRDVEQARQSALGAVNTVEAPVFSSLVRKPLPQLWGGVAHEGGENFTSPDDPALRVIERWISMEGEGGEDPEPAELNPREQYFGEEVQPKLVGRACAVTNCHGPTAFIPFRLEPGIPGEEGELRFSVEMTRKNYEEVRPFLSLDGDPTQSRVLRKALPLNMGGIVHRGGNRSFIEGPDDPAYRALVEWARLERDTEVGPDASDAPSGFVFVRGPVRSAPVFDPSGFVGGRDLFLKEPVGADDEETNLTAEHHDGAADIRDPDASPEGTHVVFSMRRGESDAHRIYELELGSGELRSLTDGPARTPSGRVIADLSPAYGPDGHVYFTSNRHDVMAERHDALDYDLYRVPREGGVVERLTYTPAPELEPAIFREGTLHDYLVFSYRRAVDHRDKTVGFSMPLDFHVDYHIFFGITPVADLFHQFEEMRDGRALTIVGDNENVWRAGQLALVDRNLGPDLREDDRADAASLPAYAPTLRVLDEAAKPRGESPGGAYRDPVALPDGTFLVARTRAALDLSDPEAEPDFDIVHVTIREAGEGCTTVECLPDIDSVETLVGSEGVGEFDPEPIYRWPASGEHHTALDPEDPTLFSMSDVTVNDGIMADLPPVGKDFRNDVRYIRFVEALPRSPEEWTPGETSLGVHAPARILAEVELADDRSVFAEVPPNVPFRTQLLDENRMSVGVQHNRWLFAWPGQHFKQSMPRQLYDQNCGGCHGAESGRPEEVLGVPQLTTRATVTLSRYLDGNPRRPQQPVRLADETRMTVDFADVQPILTRSCAVGGCHDQQTAAGGVELTDRAADDFTVAYETLLGEDGDEVVALVDERRGQARTSPLIEIAYGRQFDAPGDPDAHPEVDISEDERLILVRWIEVGAPFELPEGER